MISIGRRGVKELVVMMGRMGRNNRVYKGDAIMMSKRLLQSIKIFRRLKKNRENT